MIFRTGMEIGVSVAVDRIFDNYDVMVLAGGTEWPRDLEVPGREASNIHFAMDYLTQANRRNAGLAVDGEPIDAAGKHGEFSTRRGLRSIRDPMPPADPRFTPAATCGAGSRWWCGRSAKAANAPPRSTSI